MAKNSTELIFSESSFNKLMTILDKVEQKLTAVQKSTENLKKTSTNITFKFSGLDSLDRFLEGITRGKVNQFLDLVAGFERLIAIGSKTASFTTFVTTLNQVTGSNLKPLTDTLKILSTSLDDKAAKRLTDIAKAMKGFSSVEGASATGLAPFFTQMIEAVDKLKVLSNDDLETASKNLTRFAGGMVKILKTLDDVTVGFKKSNSAAKLGVFFGELVAALRIVASLNGVLGGGDEVKALSLAIERLGIGVAGLTRNLDTINLKSTAKLSAFLASMAVVVRLVTTIAGNADKTKALAALFTGISDLVGTVFVKFDPKKLNNDAKIFASISARINLILSVIRSIRSIKIKDAEGVAGVITAVSSLFNSLSTLGEGGNTKGGNDDTIRFFEKFIDALKNLNKINVNKDIATALQGIGNIFANLEKTDALKNAQGFGGRLSDSVAVGFIKGTIAVEIGKFILRLFTDLNPVTLTAKFVSGLVNAFVSVDTKIRQILDNIINKVKEVGTNLTNFGTTLNNTFGVGALVNSNGFQIAAEFENLANKSKVVGNLSKEALDEVLAVADAVGQKYPVSANQALAAIIDLQKAGINAVPDIKAVIEPIANLAALSDSGDIGAASKTIIQVISSFKELSDGVQSTFDNAAVAADILSRAADNSTASVESLALGIGNVGPTASAFGLSLEETAAILGIFEDRGIRGAEAGTQLKSVLGNLTRPTDAVRGELAKLNIKLTDSQGNFRDINDIVNDFNHAFNDTTTVTRLATNVTGANAEELEIATRAYASAQRQIFLYQNGLKTGVEDQDEANKKIAEYQTVLNNASAAITRLTGDSATAQKITMEISRTQEQNFESLNTIFGTFGRQGAAILTSLGDDAIKNFVDQMGRLPTAAERAEQLMQSFTGQVEQLRGSGETLLKNFFLPLIDTIFYPLVQGFLAITNSLLNLNPEVLATIATATALGSILASIVGVGSIVAGFFITFGGTILGLATSFLTLSGAVGFITSFAASIAGLVVGFTSFLAIAAPVAIILGSLAAAFRVVVRVFSENIGGATDSLRAFGQRVGVLVDYFVKIASSVGEFIGLIIGDGAGAGLEKVGEFFANFFDTLSDKVNAGIRIFSKLNIALTSFLDFFKNGINPSASSLEGLNRLASNPFISFLLNKGGFEKSATGVNLLFRSLADGVRKAAAEFQIISSGIGDLFTSLVRPELFAVGKQKIVDGLSGLASQISSAIQSIFGVDLADAIAAFDVGDLSKGIAELLTKAIDGVKNLLLANRDGIKNILTGIFSFFFVPGGFLAIVTDFLGLKDVSSFIRGVQGTITSLFGGIVDTVFNILAGQDLKTALINSFGSGIEPVIKFVETLGEVVGTAIGFFQDLIAVIFPSRQEAAEFNLLDIVTNVLTFLTDSLHSLDVNVLTPLRSLIRGIDLTGLYDFISNLFGQFSNFFSLVFSGDFGGAIDQLAGIGSTIAETLKNVISSIFDFEFTDNADIITNIAEGIVGILRSAANAVSRLLGFDDFGNLVTSVVESIKNFFGPNPSEKFAELGETLIRGLADAVLNAFGKIGEFLGLDPAAAQKSLEEGFGSLIEGVRSFFLGDDGSGIFGDIETIFGKIGTAIQNVLNLFTGGEQASGEIFTIADALQKVYDFLANLVSLALDTLGDSLKGIADFFDRLATLPPDQLLALGGALLVLGAALLPILAPGLVTAISGVFGALTTGLGIFATVLIVGNIAENLGLLAEVFKSLLNLDIAGAAEDIINFFGSIAAGVTFDILKLFGIDTIAGVTEDSVKTTIATIAAAAAEALTNIGNGLKDFVDNTVLPAKDRLISLVKGAVDFFKGVADLIGNIIGKIGIILSVVGTLLLSPIIAVFKIVQGFVELPQEQKDRFVKFFVALGIALAVLNAGSIASALGSLGGFLLTMGSSAVAGGFSLLTTLPGILAGIGSSLLTIGSSIVAFVAPVLAAIVIFTTLASAVQNLDKLFSAIFNIVSLLGSLVTLDVQGIFQSIGAIIGDLVDFIGSTLVDAFFTIADFFGVTDVLGQTKEQIKTTLEQIVTIIKAAFIGLGNVISNFFTNTFDDISRRLQIAAADLRLAVSDAAARARTVGGGAENDAFFKAQNLFDPSTFNLGKLTAALLDSTIDQQAIRDFAIKNADLIKGDLITQLQTGDTGGDSLFKIDTAIQFVAASNNLNDVVRQIFSLDGETGQLAQQTFITGVEEALRTGRIDQKTADDTLNSIFKQVGTGTLSPESAIAILNSIDFTGTNISDAKREELVGILSGTITQAAEDAKVLAESAPKIIDPAQVIKIQKAAEAKDADLVLPVNVEVEPNVVPPTDPITLIRNIAKLVTDTAKNNAVKITPEVPVTPAFTGITNQKDVTKFQQDVDLLKGSLEDSNQRFDEFAGKVNDNVDNLQKLADKVTTTSATMQTSFDALLRTFTNFRDTVTRGVDAISGAFARAALAIGALSVSLLLNIPIIQNNIGTLNSIFIEMGNVASSAFDKALGSVAKLDRAIKSLINDIDVAIDKAGSLKGIDVAGNRERGGPVWKGLFEVAEGDKPELLFQNGRMFLISPGGGQVEPIQPVGDRSGVNSSFGVQQPIPQANQNPTVGGGLTNNLTIQEGDIVLQVSGGALADYQIQEIRQSVRQELDNRNKGISDRLRTAGRS